MRIKRGRSIYSIFSWKLDLKIGLFGFRLLSFLGSKNLDRAVGLILLTTARIRERGAPNAMLADTLNKVVPQRLVGSLYKGSREPLDKAEPNEGK